MSEGKIYYYENGLAHLTILKRNTKSGNFSTGTYCHFSKTINSPIAPALPTTTGGKHIKAFKNKHPEYKPLFNCIGKYYLPQMIRSCVRRFN